MSVSLRFGKHCSVISNILGEQYPAGGWCHPFSVDSCEKMAFLGKKVNVPE
jgi:hypothetical protein